MNSSPLWINYDGSLLPSGTPFLGAGSRAFRYGDGIFETMLVENDHIRLGAYHFDRLASGLNFLRFDLPLNFTPEILTAGIVDLCRRNGQQKRSRVRLVVFRGEGSLFDPTPAATHYVIESWPLPDTAPEPTPPGIVIDVYPDGRKACDPLANLKSNNYLLYVLAARYALDQGLDDCLVLNSRETLADSSIANLFYCRDGQWYTPPLTDGGVAGVMRRHLLAVMPAAGFPVHEKTAAISDILDADEVFLTNAIRGIRTVAAFRNSSYSDTLTTPLRQKLMI